MKHLIYIFLLFPIAAFAQKQVSGQVIDIENQEPIIGASVYVSLTAVEQERSVVGGLTDIDGKFSFEVPEQAKNLIVSFTGYETQTIKIDQQTNDLKISLKLSVQMLDEIVTTGYQETTLRKATSSYVKVEAKDIKQVGVADVDQMLAGQLAGVWVQPTNGAPGAPAKIRIRGTATLNGSSDPLWVLDGIPLDGNQVPSDFTDKDNIDQLKTYPIAGINPDDIESITVLKDAAATSIYGARAANGVIVITTKTGEKGKNRININAATFITQRPDFSKLNLMNSSQKVDFELFLASRPDLDYQSERGEVARILNSLGEYDDLAEKGFSGLSPEAQAAINKLRTTNTNWGEELYRTTINQQYGLSMSGGNDKNVYYFSAGYYDEQAATIGAGKRRFNLTVKNTYSLNNYLKFGAALFGSQNKTYSYLRERDAITSPAAYVRNVNPYLGLRDENGDFIYDPDLTEISDVDLDYNVLEERQNTSNELIANSFKSIFNLDLRTNIGLRLSTQLGLQFDNERSEQFSDENSYFTRKFELRSKYTDSSGEDLFYLPKGGIIQNSNSNAFQYTWKTTANYGQLFFDRHDVDILIGTEFRERTNTDIDNKAFGFNPNTLTSIPITNDLVLTNSGFKQYQKFVAHDAFTSFFGTLSYIYSSKYSIYSSLRYDGSNLFGVNPKFRYLPIWSVAGAWTLSNESFFSSSYLDILKFRVSYGIQGNIDKTTSPFVIGTFNTESVLPGIEEEVIRTTGAPNADLRWEKTTSINLGFDLGLWGNRVFLTSDYYYRKSTDIIGFRSVPLESGFNFINTNWATISNRGFEIVLNTVNVSNKRFRWSTAFNISSNKSKVNQIEIREEEFTPSRKGYGADAVFAIKTDGVDSNGLPLFKKDGRTLTAVEFYNLAEGTDGSQLTREEHRNLYTYIGDAAPKFTGGLNNTFRYGPFDLQISANFSFKQLVRRLPSYNMTVTSPRLNYSTEILSAGEGSLPGLIGRKSRGFDTELVYRWFNSFDVGNTYDHFDIWIKEISYVRINSIRLGYNLPNQALKKLNISSARVFVEGRNLFVFGTKIENFFDPETYGSQYAQPIPRMISTGLKVSF
ncbi:SusC/RagA family TonB-linked outer membrane protein [Reichenbachiella versicolor]|uniref:SusC/RagA family TonB-linked outer membrane protein n=1 Tax=Reichenbachiella versicolor TaxID=1821036 RepID=UPI000D6E6DE2|nr:SusC/RagA family TonB-linked outer membrane protein [Reichenbachiella versicolor]